MLKPRFEEPSCFVLLIAHGTCGEKYANIEDGGAQ